MENLRSFLVTFVMQTNTTPHKLKIFDNLNRKSVTVNISEIDELINTRDNAKRAQAWLKQKCDIECKFQSEIYGKGIMLLTDNFTTKLK